jgi:hypothetical protein
MKKLQIPTFFFVSSNICSQNSSHTPTLLCHFLVKESGLNWEQVLHHTFSNKTKTRQTSKRHTPKKNPVFEGFMENRKYSFRPRGKKLSRVLEFRHYVHGNARENRCVLKNFLVLAGVTKPRDHFRPGLRLHLFEQ